MNKKKKEKQNNDIIEMFLNPNDELITKFNEFYTSARKKTKCSTGNNINLTNNNCESINDIKLVEAFNNNKNIVLETTGISLPEWLFDLYNEHINYNYNIIMAWTVVDICQLLFRNKKRVSDNIKKYLESTSANTVPRLPDIRKKTYTENLKKIISTFKTIIKEKCLFIKDNKCIRILIYDNNTKHDNKNNYGLLYDSYKDNDINNGIKSIEKYNVDNIKNCNNNNIKGGFKNKYKKKNVKKRINITKKRKIKRKKKTIKSNKKNNK